MALRQRLTRFKEGTDLSKQLAEREFFKKKEQIWYAE
jgi:hypothetical protein